MIPERGDICARDIYLSRGTPELTAAAIPTLQTPHSKLKSGDMLEAPITALLGRPHKYKNACIYIYIFTHLEVCFFLYMYIFLHAHMYFLTLRLLILKSLKVMRDMVARGQIPDSHRCLRCWPLLQGCFLRCPLLAAKDKDKGHVKR